jgi:antitoxin FitA
MAVRDGGFDLSINVELTEEQTRRLDERACALRVDARELARAAVTDLLSRPADNFERAAHYVLEKNRELYERLS